MSEYASIATAIGVTVLSLLSLLGIAALVGGAVLIVGCDCGDDADDAIAGREYDEEIG